MSSDWYLMSRPLFNSGYESDEFALFAQNGFEEVLESCIAQDVEIYNSRLTDTPLITRAIIQNVTGDTLRNAMQRQIICRIGTLRCGQYIKIGGKYWMVCTLPDNNMMYEKAILWQCRYTLKFISPVSGDIVKYPVYDINSTQYGSGETQKKYMTIGTAQHLIYIPYNDETIKLDSGFRFLIDKNRSNPTAYRLAQVDSESYACGDNDGLLQWTVVESQRDDETDNKELMIADYYGKSKYSVPDEPQPGFRITTNADCEVTFGNELRIDLRFYQDGKEISPFPFNAVIVDGNEYGTITHIGNDYIMVRALNNRDYIGQEITIEISNTDLSVITTKILTIKGWY